MPRNPRFQSTRWSLVVRSADLRDSGAREALAELCEMYWSPLDAFARRSGLEPEDAADRVQGFFAYLLQSGQKGGVALNAADPERGRFRSYLLGAFRHYLAEHRRFDGALKRGANAPHVSLDVPEADRLQVEADSEETPEALYERRWALTLIELAQKRLQGEYEALGKGALFEALKPLLSGEARRGASKAAAAELGLSPGATRVAAHRLRRRFGEVLRHEVAQTVASSDQIEAELKYLITIFQR